MIQLRGKVQQDEKHICVRTIHANVLVSLLLSVLGIENSRESVSSGVDDKKCSSSLSVFISSLDVSLNAFPSQTRTVFFPCCFSAKESLLQTASSS